MGELQQVESRTVRPAHASLLDALPSWQLVILAALTLWLYGPTLTHLLGQWWHDPISLMASSLRSFLHSWSGRDAHGSYRFR